jgi:hypothetical protein
MRKSSKKRDLTCKHLTLKDAIEVLAIYNLEHCRFPHNYFSETEFGDIPKLRGATIDDKRLILIDIEQGIEQTKEAVIHEILHGKHFIKGDLPNDQRRREKAVDVETDVVYLKLYGVKP